MKRGRIAFRLPALFGALGGLIALMALPALMGLIALLSLVSCATEPTTTAGGGGFGGETISGVVVGGSGRGVTGASVRLRASGSLESGALRTAATDSTGFFRIEQPAGAAFRLEVAGLEKSGQEGPGQGTDSLRALIDIDRGQSPGRILAEARPPRQVRLRDPSGKPVSATLQAYGLGRTAATDDSGYAALTGWPSADLWVRATLTNGQAGDVFVPSAGGDLEIEAGWLVDDFESGLNRTRLGSLIGGGWWYVASLGADSQSTRDIALTRDTLDAHGGRASLHADFSFPASSGYGLAGFHFGPTQADPVDLSGLDSLVFYIKGRGAVRVEFVADTGGGVTSHAFNLAPDTAWTRHSVAASALAPIDPGRTWAVDSKRVRFLQFIVFQTAEFRLDDLRYFGKARP